MPPETVAWLVVNVVVGLLTLVVALYVTRESRSDTKDSRSDR